MSNQNQVSQTKNDRKICNSTYNKIVEILDRIKDLNNLSNDYNDIHTIDFLIKIHDLNTVSSYTDVHKLEKGYGIDIKIYDDIICITGKFNIRKLGYISNILFDFNFMKDDDMYVDLYIDASTTLQDDNGNNHVNIDSGVKILSIPLNIRNDKLACVFNFLTDICRYK